MSVLFWYLGNEDNIYSIPCPTFLNGIFRYAFLCWCSWEKDLVWLSVHKKERGYFRAQHGDIGPFLFPAASQICVREHSTLQCTILGFQFYEIRSTSLTSGVVLSDFLKG